MDTYLMDYKNCIDFALWLFQRQTEQEQFLKETVVENGVGFNHPDSLALSSLLICLRDNIPYTQKELVKIGLQHLKPRLIKYRQQFKIYDNSRTKETGR